jgi:hypothetical protein
MRIRLVLAVIMVIDLAGCTATNKYKGPNFTFDDTKHDSAVKPSFFKVTPVTKDSNDSKEKAKDNSITFANNCSEAHSVHSPIIWLPVLGPGLDLLLVPSVSELSYKDAWSWFPLVGPPFTYTYGAQSCVYHNLHIPSSDSETQEEAIKNAPDIEWNVPSDFIDKAIDISNQNCSNYRHVLEAGFHELDANQKFISDAATVTQTGAAFANPVAAAVIGGLKQTVTSANDAIKTAFFESFGVRQLFENIAAVRKNLIDDFLKENGNQEKSKKTSYSAFRRFMTNYDKSCTFEQAISDLALVTKQGRDNLEASTSQSSAKPNTREKTEPSEAVKAILINNNQGPTAEKTP